VTVYKNFSLLLLKQFDGENAEKGQVYLILPLATVCFVYPVYLSMEKKLSPYKLSTYNL